MKRYKNKVVDSYMKYYWHIMSIKIQEEIKKLKKEKDETRN